MIGETPDARQFSEYWQCADCGAVLHVPTTGIAEGTPCWRCSNQPAIVGERKPTIWLPVTLPAQQRPLMALWAEERKKVGHWSDRELAAADVAVARVAARFQEDR